MTLPRFTPAAVHVERDAYGRQVPPFTEWPTCMACGDAGPLDAATGLCRPCWRSWRWSPAGGLAPRLVAETAPMADLAQERDERANGIAPSVETRVTDTGLASDFDLGGPRPRRAR